MFRQGCCLARSFRRISFCRRRRNSEQRDAKWQAITLQAATTITAIEVDDGILTTEGGYAVTTMNMNRDQLFCNDISGGNAITTPNLNGGRAESRQNLEPRMWVTVSSNGGAKLIDDSVVTITTLDAPAGPKILSVS